MTIILWIFFLYLLLTRRVSASSHENFNIHPINSTNILKVLVYTYTDGFRHDSIPTAISTLVKEKVYWGLEFDFTEDKSFFTDDNLGKYDALMFISVTGEALDKTGEAAFQRYLQSGGNFVGIHASTCALYNSSVYQATIGTSFEWHPVMQEATFIRENTTHPATANVPDKWRFQEEVYYFTSDPRTKGAVVLLSVDESSYNNESYTSNSGKPHPIAWYIDPPSSAKPLQAGAATAGRSFYTALGHSNETWQNETFINHVFSGLAWTLEGASTRAFGDGLVGSEEPGPPVSSLVPAPVVTPPPPGHALQATSGVMRNLSSGKTGVIICFIIGFLIGFYVIF